MAQASQLGIQIQKVGAGLQLHLHPFAPASACQQPFQPAFPPPSLVGLNRPALSRASLTARLSLPAFLGPSGTDTTSKPALESTIPYSVPQTQGTGQPGLCTYHVPFWSLPTYPPFQGIPGYSTALRIMGGLQGPWCSPASVSLETSRPWLEHLPGLVLTVPNTYILLPKDGQ